MTIYSQHPNRGKVQILATYQGSEGITSSTVTSLADATLAVPIVDALNRISALATVPVSIYDTRDRPTDHYPQTHLASLTDRTAHADLLNGAHSLWYEHVKLLLHQALADLDDAMAAVPAPVRTAIKAELETEASELRDALAEFSEAVPSPETDGRRYWDFWFPFVTFDGGMDDLSGRARESLDRHEKGITTEQREKAVADLRLLVTAYAQYLGEHAVLEPENFAIFDEPYDSDRYFLTVNAPQPGDNDGAWRVEIGHWEPDGPEDAECNSATGHTILSCARSAPPTASEIADLLNRSAEQPKQLTFWAETPVGATLAGTTFVVTERHTA
jgi:hypothetical protein